MHIFNPELIPTVWLSSCLILVTYFVLGARLRGTFYKMGGREKVMVAKLRIRRSLRDLPMFDKIAAEIKLFNKLRLAMPCRSGLPASFVKMLGRLHVDARWLPKGMAPEFKVLYLYAVLNLMKREACPLRFRQFHKNALFVLYSNSNLVKKHVKIKSLLAKKLSPIRPSAFKILHGERFHRIINRPHVTRSSYVFYNGVKHYVDKKLPIECYDVDVPMKWEAFTAPDKTQWSVGEGKDTMFLTNRKEGRVVAVYTPTREPVFTNTLARRKKALEVMVELSEAGKIFVVHAGNKQEAQSLIATIKDRNHQLDYLKDLEKIELIGRAEKLLCASHASRFVRGANLMGALALAKKHVPTLPNPSIIHEVNASEDLFALVDDLPVLNFLAQLGVRLNVIALHSSQNAETHAVMEAFLNTNEVRNLIERGILFFFIDRMKADSAVIGLLSAMGEAAASAVGSSGRWGSAPTSDCKSIIVSVQESGNVTSIFVNNSCNRRVQTRVVVPLDFINGLRVCRKVGRKLFIGDVEYRLPFGSCVLANGTALSDGTEALADELALVLEVSLKSYEERIFDIVKKVKTVDTSTDLSYIAV